MHEHFGDTPDPKADGESGLDFDTTWMARPSTRDSFDLVRRQMNRPVEQRLTAGKLTDEDISNWVKKLREFTAFGEVREGLVAQVRAAISTKLSSRYRSFSKGRSDEGIKADLVRMVQFIVNTQVGMVEQKAVSKKAKDAYAGLFDDIVGLQTLFSLLTNPNQEANWVADAATQKMLFEILEKLQNYFHSVTALTSVWREIEHFHELSTNKKAKLIHLQTSVPALGSTLISHAYHLSREMLPLTTDPFTQEMLSDAWDIVAQLAKEIIAVQQKVESHKNYLSQRKLTIVLNPLGDISDEHMKEAQEIWNELIA